MEWIPAALSFADNIFGGGDDGGGIAQTIGTMGGTPGSGAGAGWSDGGIGGILGSVGGGIGSILSALGSNPQMLQSIMNIGGGLYGMNLMGGLKDSLQMPSDVSSLPGYKAGLDAVERKMGSQGFNGSGNMMAELAQYGGNFYNQEAQRRLLTAQAQMPMIQGQLSSLGLLGSGVKKMFP